MSSETPNRPFSTSATDQPEPSPPESTGASSVERLKDKVGTALDRGKSGIAESASAARDSLANDLARLREDVTRMQETISRFTSRAGGEAARTARNVSQAVTSEAGSAAAELENMVRRNPLGTLAGALVAGIFIGMMTRGRR
jgi:ElaB/YqjD/DUF883 family membrane-anchored ribosome-binding protein